VASVGNVMFAGSRPRRARAWYQADVEIPAEVEIPVAAMMAEETLADDNVAV